MLHNVERAGVAISQATVKPLCNFPKSIDRPSKWVSHCSGWSDTNNPSLSTSNLLPHQLHLDLILWLDKLDRWTHHALVAEVCRVSRPRRRAGPCQVNLCGHAVCWWYDDNDKAKDKMNKKSWSANRQVNPSQWLKNSNELRDCFSVLWFLLTAFSLFSYCAYGNEGNGQEGGIKYIQGGRG